MKAHLHLIFFLSLIGLNFTEVHAQQNGLPAESRSIELRDSTEKKSFTQRNLFKFTAAPAILISTGVWTMETETALNKYDFQESVQGALPDDFRTHIDDYTQIIPQVYTLGHVLWNKPGKEKTIDLLTKMAVSNMVMGITIKSSKSFFAKSRPDNPNSDTSFPSGHTATAFTSATIMHKELGKESLWYSVAGYTLATATGAMRVMNNRHYISDVLAGAGVGILTTHFSYWLVDTIKTKSRRKKSKEEQIRVISRTAY